MGSNIIFDTKLIKDIEGKFYVPSYQRGYRWGTDEVTRLLEDISAVGPNDTYYLQPVVVKNLGDSYELIDGQQRLTTIYLIYKYMKNVGGAFMKDAKFSLEYQTRKKSEEFLNTIDLSMRDDNIDFWFICQAYEAIQNWFTSKNDLSSFLQVSSYFEKNVKIIWYEVGQDEDAIALFTRLNIGKIPLTSAELVKAMFLSKDNNAGIDREKQEEIALQWDNIEKELHNEALWYFLTNDVKDNYSTRIDLILDLISNKPADNREKYYTFFELDRLKKEKGFKQVWKDIQHTFLSLKDWRENHELYHKIGYLIASETKTLQELFKLSKDKNKDDFIVELDNLIKESINIKGNYAELSYDKALDYKKISKLLLLFNVESVRQNGEHTQWFPFDKFKFSGDKKVSWSLEHIHAQQSEGMKTQESWKKWLELHIISVRNVAPDKTQLIGEMEELKNGTVISRENFENVQKSVYELLSAKGNIDYIHSISNLALLNSNDNAALNNSTFDVKRNEIIEMDKQGQYIPFCTKMVFLKYYTKSADNQLHFWGYPDRIAYVSAINTVLDKYLSEKIQLEKEES